MTPDDRETASTLNEARNQDRRASARTPLEEAATALLEIILRNPQKAMAQIERDLKSGVDRDGLLTMLNAAEQVAQNRGISIRALAGIMRSRITRG